MSGIVISDSDLNLIKVVLAYPSVENIILTDSQIKDLCCYPALHEYFLFFPIRSVQEYWIATSTDTAIPFPDDTTYGIIDARVVGKHYLTGTGSTFWDLVYFNSMGMATSRRSGMYGQSGYNPNNLRQQILMQRSANASLQNLGSIHTRVDNEGRKVWIASSITGRVNITWAKYSMNFDDIKYEWKLDAIKLVQSNLLQHLADTTGIMTNSDSSISVNASDLKARAEELKTEVMDKWRSVAATYVINLRQT